MCIRSLHLVPHEGAVSHGCRHFSGNGPADPCAVAREKCVVHDQLARHGIRITCGHRDGTTVVRAVVQEKAVPEFQVGIQGKQGAARVAGPAAPDGQSREPHTGIRDPQRATIIAAAAAGQLQVLQYHPMVCAADVQQRAVMVALEHHSGAFAQHGDAVGQVQVHRPVPARAQQQRITGLRETQRGGQVRRVPGHPQHHRRGRGRQQQHGKPHDMAEWNARPVTHRVSSGIGFSKGRADASASWHVPRHGSRPIRWILEGW